MNNSQMDAYLILTLISDTFKTFISRAGIFSIKTLLDITLFPPFYKVAQT